MVEPRPIRLTQVDEADYKSEFEPQPMVVVGPIPGGGGGGGGGDVSSVNGKTGAVVLSSGDVGAASATDVAGFVQNVSNAVSILESDLDSKAATTYVDNQLATKASATDLDNVFGIATNAQTLATDAVPKTRTVAGKPLSANITLDKIDVNLSNVDNTSDVNKPVSTAQQTALNLKANSSDVVPNTRTVAGKALSSNITLAKGDVGLGNVDNTSDANKPVSTAQATAINAKVGSPNSTITGLAYYPTVASLPATGTAGVIYYVDSV